MTVATDEPLPSLRLLPAPDPEPPLHEPTRASHLRLVRPVQDQLPLDWPLANGMPSTPRPTGLVLIRGRQADGDDFGPVPTPREALPEPAPWAARLVQGIAEVLALDRPLTQLVRWASPDVYDDLRLRVDSRRRGRAQRDRVPGRRPTVRSVHVTEPSDGVAEVCAVVDEGRRPRAYALRLEGADGRWRATALDLV
jgi:Family of unknown function (DUF6459)